MSTTSAGELLKPAEVAERLAISERAVNQLRYLGTGPRFIRVSHKAVRYRAADVDAWLEARSRTSTSGEAH